MTGQLVDLTPHQPVLPIVLPLAVAAFMLLLEERRRIFKAGLGAATTAALVLVSFVLLNEVAGMVDAGKLRTTMTERFSPIDAATLKRVHAMIEAGSARGKLVLEGFPPAG